jgi:hypothetical protein
MRGARQATGVLEYWVLNHYSITPLLQAEFRDRAQLPQRLATARRWAFLSNLLSK